MKAANLNSLRSFLVSLLMLTIAYALQASGMLATAQPDILVLFVGTVKRKDALLRNVHNQRIRRRQLLARRKKFQSWSWIVEEHWWNKSLCSDDPCTYNQNEWDAPESGKGIKIFHKGAHMLVWKEGLWLEHYPCHKLSQYLQNILTAFHLPYIHPYVRVLISQMKHHLIWLLHPSLMVLFLVPALPLQLHWL